MLETFQLGPEKIRAKNAWILLIDDSRFIRRLFAKMFQALGFRVETAAGGQTGIELAAAQHYDVIVVDGFLPDMEGRNVCRQISKQPGEKPILILYTASDRLHKERHGAFIDGVDACMKKEVDGAELVTRIEELLTIRESRRLARIAQESAPVRARQEASQ